MKDKVPSIMMSEQRVVLCPSCNKKSIVYMAMDVNGMTLFYPWIPCVNNKFYCTACGKEVPYEVSK